eukprot:1368180-Rhodomonas_salina.1
MAWELGAVCIGCHSGDRRRSVELGLGLLLVPRCLVPPYPSSVPLSLYPTPRRIGWLSTVRTVPHP